jgi:hypothetical protein
MSSPTGQKPACRFCRHFRNDPSFLEEHIPGLASLSSAFASVRSDDGLCLRHDTLQSAGSVCPCFEPHSRVLRG